MIDAISEFRMRLNHGSVWWSERVPSELTLFNSFFYCYYFYISGAISSATMERGILSLLIGGLAENFLPRQGTYFCLLFLGRRDLNRSAIMPESLTRVFFMKLGFEELWGSLFWSVF